MIMKFHELSLKIKSLLPKVTRKRLQILAVLVVCGTGFLYCVDSHVGSTAEGRIFDKVEDCPDVPVAVVLGTAKYYYGRDNLFYIYRIRAAAELYKAGRVKAIIVSGDNSRKDYDEPSQMKADLVELGVDEEYITCDYAGFRTLDSIIRAEKVFGQKNIIVISQRFHCERAVFLAQKKGYEAYGYVAKDVQGCHGAKVRLREILARCKAVMDLIIDKQPKYLGEQVVVQIKP